MTKRMHEITADALLLCLIFGALFYLRMMPVIDKKIDFTYDCAFNYRMTADVLKDGRVPSVDRLSTYPEGKDIKAFLPTGIYHLCVSFHKFLNHFADIPLSRSILFFGAICGSLICVPVFFISYEIYRNKAAAYLTALLAGMMPAYIGRTASFLYRHEIAAVPVLFVSLLFFMKAFGARTAGKTFIFSAASAAILVAAQYYLWRLSVLFLFVYSLAVVYVWLKEEQFQKRWLIIIFTIAVPYLLLPWFFPGLGAKNPDFRYGAFPAAAAQIILNSFGFNQDFTGFTRLVSNNFELRPIGLPVLFSWVFLSASSIFLIVYLLAYIFGREKKAQKDILMVFLFFYLIFTLIFRRNAVVLGPLVALTLGEGMTFAFRNKKAIIRWAVTSLIVMALVKIGFDSYMVAGARYVNAALLRIEPNLVEAMDAVNRLTPKGSAILGHWSDGYVMQTYGERPTTTDGLLESSEIVRRIVSESGAYYSSSEDDLWNLCKKYGTDYILLRVDKKNAYAIYAGLDFRRYYGDAGPTDEGMMTTLFRLIYTPERIKRFSLLFRNENFLLYAVK